MRSIVITTYIFQDSLEQQAVEAALSFRPYCDELIIVEDGGRSSQLLQNIADTYIYHDKNHGVTRNVNIGWEASSGDYTMFIHSDSQYLWGDLNDLCIEGRVTSPVNLTGDIYDVQRVSRLRGDFFVVPKEIKKERGVLNERMITYFSDDDYYERIKDIFFPVYTVGVRHKGSSTHDLLGQEWKDNRLIRDGKVFFEIYPDHEFRTDFERRLGTLAKAILK